MGKGKKKKKVHNSINSVIPSFQIKVNAFLTYANDLSLPHSLFSGE